MNTKALLEKPLLLYVLLLLSGLSYYSLAYQTARENFVQLISLFTFLFAAYYVMCKFFSGTHFKYLLFSGFFFRILLLSSIPSLSNDVYRFIWDGRLAAAGINPFSYLPIEIMQMPPVKGITKELYGQLNSPNYYTVYPPVLQGMFWLSGKLFPAHVFGAIVFMKCIILTVELANLFLLIQLLKKCFLPRHLSLLYLLNPLVTAELTGNVHFEGVIIFFVLLAFLLMLQNNWQSSAIGLALGIATKLSPVLFLPLMVKQLGWKKGLIYSLITSVTTFILFVFVFNIASAQHLLKGVDLFIRKFEFNASLYYIIRWVGTKITGYNIIAFAGPALSLIAAGLVLFISSSNKKITVEQFFARALFTTSIWYLFSTTVHPWYICLPVAMSVFTPYRYAIIWSFTATWSYSAYQSNPVQENLWLVGAGYIFMIGYALWELKLKRQATTRLA